MTKQVSPSNSVTNRLQRSRPIEVAVLGLGMASSVFAPVEAAPANTAKGPVQEESVLIATREAPPTEAKATNTGTSEALEPTAQSSDRIPEVATSTGKTEKPSGDSHFGDALARIAQPIKHEPAAKDIKTAQASAESTSEPADEEKPSVSGPARRAAAARAESVAFEPVKFQGISVGKTSKHELIAAWGQPADTANTSEGEVLTYHKSPFQAV